MVEDGAANDLEVEAGGADELANDEVEAGCAKTACCCAGGGAWRGGAIGRAVACVVGAHLLVDRGGANDRESSNAAFT